MFTLTPKSAQRILIGLPFPTVMSVITASFGARWLNIIYMFPEEHFSEMFHRDVLCSLGASTRGSMRYFHAFFMTCTAVGLSILSLTSAYLWRRMTSFNAISIKRIVSAHIIASIGICGAAWTPVDVEFWEYPHYFMAMFGIYGLAIGRYLDTTEWLNFLRETHKVPATTGEKNFALLMQKLSILSFWFFNLYIISEGSLRMNWTRRFAEFEWIALLLIVPTVFGFVNQGLFIAARNVSDSETKGMLNTDGFETLM